MKINRADNSTILAKKPRYSVLRYLHNRYAALANCKHSLIIHVIFFAGVLSLSPPVLASAPVEDDSENFVLLEEQAQAAEELPVAREETYALAQDAKEVTHAIGHHKTDTTRNIDFVNNLQSLQKEVQELRGQLEVQGHELEELKQQQLAYYQDLDTRLNHAPLNPNHQTMSSKSEPSNPTLPATDSNNTTSMEIALQPPQQKLATPANAIRQNPADEQISYLAAYDLVKQKQFSQATEAMQQFLSKYPHGGYSANAHYWLGELHLTNKEYSEAISQFNMVLENFKTSSKYAPSRLKLGYALAQSGRIDEAKKQLTTVVNLYPDTPTANLARAKLEKLGG